MIQIRTGDLVAVSGARGEVLMAILTPQILFGGHWSYVFHGARDMSSGVDLAAPGFNAVVDLLPPKRENRVSRVSRGNDFASLQGPELLQQPPLKGETNFRIWRWKNGLRDRAEFVRATPSPTPEEKCAPRYACIPAAWAYDLALANWTEGSDLWATVRSPPQL